MIKRFLTGKFSIVIPIILLCFIFVGLFYVLSYEDKKVCHRYMVVEVKNEYSSIKVALLKYQDKAKLISATNTFRNGGVILVFQRGTYLCVKGD